MYRRKADCELFYDRRESIGSPKSSLLLENNFGTYSRDHSSSSDHYNPTLRLLKFPRSSNGSFGFHLTRSKWDPYPWISAVDANTTAKFYGLKAGECVLEVNGEDVLGMRTSEISDLLNSDTKLIDEVALLLWSPGSDNNCNPTNLCCGPMPLNLERLTAFTQTILAIIECPVCLETMAPPILQCQNGHILCVKCRILSRSCPMCRQYFYPGRSLVAEQIYNSIMDTFNLRSTDKSHGRDGQGQQLFFGAKYKTSSPSISMSTLSSSASSSVSSLLTMGERRQGQQEQRLQKQQNNGISLKPSPPEVNKFESLQLPAYKFLAKLRGRANSMENLSTAYQRRRRRQHRRQSAPPLFLTRITIRRITDDNIGGGKDKVVVVEYFENQVNCNSNVVLSDGQLELHKPTALKPPVLRKQASISKQLSLSAHDLSKKDNDGSIAIQHESLSKNRLHCLGVQRNSLDMAVLSVSPVLSAEPPTLAKLVASSSVSKPTKISASSMKNRQSMKSAKQISCCTEQLAFYCPFSCGKQFSGPALQQHIKVDHSAPILCYNSSSAELALPLRAPLDKAVVLLMCDGKDFWIKLRTHGREENITALAVFQGPQDESSDFIMETRLRNRTSKEQEIKNNTHQHPHHIVVDVAEDDDEDEEDEEENDYVKIIDVNKDNGILERQLITRSIVRSMNVATWEHTYFEADRKEKDEDEEKECEHFLYNQEDIRMAFGESIDFWNLLLEIIIKKKKCRNEWISKL